MKLGSNTLMIRHDRFPTIALWVLEVVEWIGTKRSIFVLLVEFAITLINLLE